LKPLLAADLLDTEKLADGFQSAVHVSAPTETRLLAFSRVQLVGSRRLQTKSWRLSSELRNRKPLELLANVWSRLLLWFGGRR
jgi:hypothetical protein